MDAESQALLTTRRWVVVALASLIVAASALLGTARWGQMTSAERGLLLLAAVVVILGSARSARSAWLWACEGALVALLLGFAVSTPSSPPWLPMPNLYNAIFYIGLTLIPRRTGLVVALVAPFGLAAIWALGPANIASTATPVLGGWVAVGQALAAFLFLWWAWHTLVAEASGIDRLLEERERATALAIATQERAQLWRATATQVHESVLNSIRYVLTVPHPDTARLAAQVQAEALATQPAPKAPVREPAELLAAVRSAGVDARVQQAGGVPPVGVTADVFDAARSALVEVVRNAVEHGRAATITVRLEQPSPDELSIVVDDDGTGIRGAPTPGIGLRTVLQQSLAGVEGRWTLADSPSGGVQARITVPVIGRKPERRAGGPYRPFDKGRFLVAAPLAGAAMVGSVYFLLLAVGGGPREWLAAVLGLIGIVAAVVLVTRRRRVNRWLGASLIAAPALVPWTLAGPSYDCSIASGLAPTLNVAGFAVLLIAAWSGYLPGQVGLLVWGSGAAVVLAALPDSCRSDVALAMLNALVVIPVALVATYAGIRVHQRAAARARQARESAITEVSRAQAAVDLAAQLEDSVADAVTALTSVARGTPVDGALRHRLELADGRIRAAIQVDPKRAGAFAVLAQALVEEAAASDQAVIVRAVGSSADSRPIPDAVRSALMVTVARSSDTPPVLQAFTDGVEDHLTLLVGSDAARAAGLAPGSGQHPGQVVVEVDEDAGAGGNGRTSLLVSRPVLAASAAAHPRSVRLEQHLDEDDDASDQ